MSPELFSSKSDLFAAIISRYKWLMNDIAMKIMKDEFSADDVVQDAMVKIINNIDMIDDIDSNKCKNLIFLITKNTAIDAYRKRQSELDKMFTAEDIFDVEEMIHDDVHFDVFENEYNFSEEMKYYMSQLKAADRDILCMRYGELYSEIEIAAIMGISYDAVRQRISRARQRLGIIMERGMKDHE